MPQDDPHPNMKRISWEVRHHESEDGFSNIDATFRSLTIQWNPMTAIAVQRFLGRASKGFSNRSWSNMVKELSTGDPILKKGMEKWSLCSDPTSMRRRCHFVRVGA